MNDDSNKSNSSSSSCCKCEHVSYLGRTGCLELTTMVEGDENSDPLIRFESTTTSKSTSNLNPRSSLSGGGCWGLSNIENHSIRAVSSTLTLELVNGGTVSFQLKTLPDLVRFRKALVLRQRQQRQHHLHNQQQQQQQQNQQQQQQTLNSPHPTPSPPSVKMNRKEEVNDPAQQEELKEKKCKQETILLKENHHHQQQQHRKQDEAATKKERMMALEEQQQQQKQKRGQQQQQQRQSSSTSVSSAELQDDLVAREILQMTGAFCHQQQEQQQQQQQNPINDVEAQLSNSAKDAEAKEAARSQKPVVFHQSERDRKEQQKLLEAAGASPVPTSSSDRDLKEQQKLREAAGVASPVPTDDRDLKEQQKLASGAGVASPALVVGLKAQEQKTTKSATSTTTVVPRDTTTNTNTTTTKTMIPIHMQTATASVEVVAEAEGDDETEGNRDNEENPTSQLSTTTTSSHDGRRRSSCSQRGPGAYRRMPGAQSTRASTDFSLVGNVEAECSMIFRLSNEMDNIAAGSNDNMTAFSDEQCSGGGGGGGGHMRDTPSSRWLMGSSSRNQRKNRDPMVQASLVEETAEVRYSTVMPSAVQVDPSLNVEEERKKVAMGFSGGCCIIMIIVATIVAVVTFVLVSKKSDGGTDGQNNNNNNNNGGMVLMTGNRMEAFQELVLPVTTDPASLMEDNNSPAYRACQWLAEQDPKQLDPTDTSQHEQIIQRYILTLFYYQSSSDGGSWRYCYPPDTGEVSACRHKLLESYGFEGVYHNEYMLENAFRWLSEAEECLWAGVRCEDGKHVSSIQLGGYGLQGALPVELVHLTHLKVLDLQQNHLHSTLPPEFGWIESSPKHLETLRLDQNKFTGSIPEEWCLLSEDSLETLILSGNQLTGSLPDCLGDLVHLKDFSVMSNQLTGTIPETLSDCANLERFHFALNNFKGSIPASICDVESLQELSSDCLDNDDVLECSCCTKCCDPSTNSCELTAFDTTNQDGGN